MVTKLPSAIRCQLKRREVGATGCHPVSEPLKRTTVLALRHRPQLAVDLPRTDQRPELIDGIRAGATRCWLPALASQMRCRFAAKSPQRAQAHESAAGLNRYITDSATVIAELMMRIERNTGRREIDADPRMALLLALREVPTAAGSSSVRFAFVRSPKVRPSWVSIPRSLAPSRSMRSGGTILIPIRGRVLARQHRPPSALQGARFAWSRRARPASR